VTEKKASLSERALKKKGKGTPEKRFSLVSRGEKRNQTFGGGRWGSHSGINTCMGRKTFLTDITMWKRRGRLFRSHSYKEKSRKGSFVIGREERILLLISAWGRNSLNGKENLPSQCSGGRGGVA